MNGIIIINKESGWTSHDVVARLRKLLHEKRIGHAGTLDPMATGVLPVCVGKATRLVEYIGDNTKTYIADICFGIETDSYDKEGNILEAVDCSNLTEEEICKALLTQKGDILQIPPMVSAIKINGQPLYKLAREGKTVERMPRAVTIYSIDILGFSAGANPHIICSIVCSKGTYIRSIAHDVGVLLGYGAHLNSLERAAVGKFAVEHAYTLEQIEGMLAAEDFSFLLSPEKALTDMPKFLVNDRQLHYVLHGNSCSVEAEDCDICAVHDDIGLIGIGEIKNSVLSMNKVLREI